MSLTLWLFSSCCALGIGSLPIASATPIQEAVRTTCAEEKGPKMPTLAGEVDILVAISDKAFQGHIANWGMAVVTLEIKRKRVEPWRKLVLDQRGPILKARHTAPLHLAYEDRRKLTADLPRNPVSYVLRPQSTSHRKTESTCTFSRKEIELPYSFSL